MYHVFQPAVPAKPVSRSNLHSNGTRPHSYHPAFDNNGALNWNTSKFNTVKNTHSIIDMIDYANHQLDRLHLQNGHGPNLMPRYNNNNGDLVPMRPVKPVSGTLLVVNQQKPNQTRNGNNDDSIYENLPGHQKERRLNNECVYFIYTCCLKHHRKFIQKRIYCRKFSSNIINKQEFL